MWCLRAPQGSGFQKGDLGVGLRPLQEHVGASACIFWGLPGAPRRRPLRWRQLLPRSRQHGDRRELHGFWSFGCIREPFGQRPVGEMKASLFRAAGTAGQSFEFAGDVRQVRHSKTMRLRVEGSSLWFQGVATKCFGAFFAERHGSEPVLSPRFLRRRCTREQKLHTGTQQLRHLPQLQRE